MDIITRSEWRARPPSHRTLISTPTPKLFLHHSAPPSGGDHREVGGMRAIQNYHIDFRGWSDIAYSFVVDRVSGNVYEGRGAGVAGGHTRGHNSTSHAICVMGNFDRERPSDHLLNVLSELVAYGHQRGWWPNRITGGHRDVAVTSCPGNHLYARIADINSGGSMALTAAEEKVVKDITKALGSVGSNGGFAASAVELIRANPVGLANGARSLAQQADSRAISAANAANAARSTADAAAATASSADTKASQAFNRAGSAIIQADAAQGAVETHKANHPTSNGGFVEHGLLDHKDVVKPSSVSVPRHLDPVAPALKPALVTRAATDIDPKVSRPAWVGTVAAAVVWIAGRYLDVDLPIDITEEALAEVTVAVTAVLTVVGYFTRSRAPKT